MATTEERLRKLVDENLEVDGRPIGSELHLDRNLGDAGVSSVDFVAFMKVVVQEFGVELSAGDCENFQTLADLIEYMDKEAA
jgi:acyl carrier protein